MLVGGFVLAQGSGDDEDGRRAPSDPDDADAADARPRRTSRRTRRRPRPRRRPRRPRRLRASRRSGSRTAGRSARPKTLKFDSGDTVRLRFTSEHRRRGPHPRLRQDRQRPGRRQRPHPLQGRRRGHLRDRGASHRRAAGQAPSQPVSAASRSPSPSRRVAAAILAPDALAHGIVGREDLPIPRWLFGVGGDRRARRLVRRARGAVARAAARAARERRASWPAPRVLEVLCGVDRRRDLRRRRLGRLRRRADRSTANLAPTFVYVMFWNVIPVLSLFLGDVFAAFNPWRAIGRGGVVGRRPRRAGQLPEALPYPERLGYWPAAVGDLRLRDARARVRPSIGEDPSWLAMLALVYAAVHARRHGAVRRRAWTRNGDGFAVLFRLFSTLAPLHWARRRLCCARRWPARRGAPAAGLVALHGGRDRHDVVRRHAREQLVDRPRARPPGLLDDIGISADALARDRLHARHARVVVAARRAVPARRARACAASTARTRRASWRGASRRRWSRSRSPTSSPTTSRRWPTRARRPPSSRPTRSARAGTSSARRRHDRLHGRLGQRHLVRAGRRARPRPRRRPRARARPRAGGVRGPARATRSQYWMLAVMVAFTSLGLWLLSANG